jgi:UDPglucose 6-dehydrogenase
MAECLDANRLERLVGNLKGKSLGVFGLTYKAGTGTLRGSVALEIIRRLEEEGACVKVFDPRVSRSDLASVTFRLCDDAYAACEETDPKNLLDSSEMRECGFR